VTVKLNNHLLIIRNIPVVRYIRIRTVNRHVRVDLNCMENGNV